MRSVPAASLAARGIGGTDTLVALSLAGVWILAWLLAVPSANIPLNDDWVYALAVRSIEERGRFALPSASLANVFLQAYWGDAFARIGGLSFDTLRLSTGTAAALSVPTLYFLARMAGSRRLLAAIFVGCVTLNPVFFELSATFMSDIPFLLLLSISLLLYFHHLDSNKAVSFYLAVAVAILTVLVRQFAVILLFAYSLDAVLRSSAPFRRTLHLWWPAVAGLAVHVIYSYWMLSTGRTAALGIPVSGGYEFSISHKLAQSARYTIQIVPYLSLFCLPVLLACRPERPLRRTDWRFWVGCAVAALYFLGGFVKDSSLPGLGNIILDTGMGPLTLVDTYIKHVNTRLPGPGLRLAWQAVSGLMAGVTAVLAIGVAMRLASVVADVVARRPITRQQSATVVIYVTAGLLLLASLLIAYLNGAFFDRYLLPVTLLIALDLCRTAPATPDPTVGYPRRTASLAAPVLAVWLVLSVCGTHDYIAWNKARWTATDALLAAGTAPARIDGGYEFNGTYRHRDIGLAPFTSDYWTVVDPLYVIASGSLPGFEQVSAVLVERWTGLLPAEVVVLRAKR